MVNCTIFCVSYLFQDMTAPQECSQFPLVEKECTTSLTILFISSYDSKTGVFTVPPGGDGVYYFSNYLFIQWLEYGYFDMMLNDKAICAIDPENTESRDENAAASCSAVVRVTAGDRVKVLYIDGTDDRPLNTGSNHPYAGFNGFRI